MTGSVAADAGCPLQRSFLHLPRIGLRTERKLWREGIRTWDDLEAARCGAPDLFGRRGGTLLSALDASRNALDAGNAAFFAARLPPREHYRIAAAFPQQTVFVDIETTGLSLYYDAITLIGCARGERYACHVMGTGDDRNNPSTRLIEEAKCIVTFNGTLFDLKFLARNLPDLALPAAHVDLRYLVRRVSLAGGQKEVERALGVARPDGVQDVDGAQAVLLWYEYISGNVESAKRLVRYNHADVECMKPILDHAMGRLAQDDDNPVADRSRPFADSASTLRFDKPGGSVRVPPFSPPADSAMTYDRLTAAIADELRIVGIDLTGAESRPSGWCELRGRNAATRMIGPDAELMAAIERARPHLVSIDSPLSLPSGRLRVEDDDPGRAEFGIMRICERTLKRRGINVYPCLIPSMQRLTARGIRIAAALRARGIPVIESYPGAAQDIMNIPRKGAGPERLKQGLELFGIAGEYARSKVTHDELDAITAAIVGAFFWAGRYEALGTDDEDYLIIPSLQPESKVVARPQRIVGVSGPIAAGKTTAAQLLESAGFRYARYSQVIADLAQERSRTPDRATLQEIGERVHRDPGQRWLNEQLLRRAGGTGGDLVVDGLRWPEDHAFWVERCGPSFIHIHISAPRKVRRARYPDDAAFDAAARHGAEGGVGSLAQLAHTHVENSGTIESLRAKLAEGAGVQLEAGGHT